MKSTFTSFDQLPIMLSAKTVASALGISESKAYEIFRSKGFPVIVLGRRKLVLRFLPSGENSVPLHSFLLSPPDPLTLGSGGDPRFFVHADLRFHGGRVSLIFCSCSGSTSTIPAGKV